MSENLFLGEVQKRQQTPISMSFSEFAEVFRHFLTFLRMAQFSDIFVFLKQKNIEYLKYFPVYYFGSFFYDPVKK